MQALRRAWAGIRSSTPGLKSTCVHQHGGSPAWLARPVSIAHSLALPHKGQSSGAGLVAAVMSQL
jgi:hypothetical protein